MRDRDPLVDGEGIECAGQRRGEALAGRLVLGGNGGRDRLASHPRHRRPPARRGSNVVASVARGDRDEERAQRGLAAEARDRARKREEGLLHEVLRRRGVAEQARGEGSHVDVVRVVRLAEGVRIVGLQARDEQLFLPPDPAACHERERYRKRAHVRTFRRGRRCRRRGWER
jgi:hypothetical protein